MKTFKSAVLLLAVLAAVSPAWGSPVLYTLRTIASGTLGSMSFTNARVTITLSSDTDRVQTTTVNGANIYTNSHGSATVSITRLDGRTFEATFGRGQIYARYDTHLGLVGFASAIGLAYPIIVGCFDPFVCSDIGQTDGTTIFAHYDGIATELADIGQYPGDSWSASSYTLDLPTNLSQTTLLTGRMRSCAVAFSSTDNSCPSAPATPLHTSRGDFYMLDGGVGYSDGGVQAIFTVNLLPTTGE